MSSTLKRLTILAVVGALLLSPVMGAVVAQPATNDELNHDSDNAPGWYIYEDRVDIAAYNTSDFDDLRQYYDDNGEQAPLPASFNSSIDNRVAFTADAIEDEDLTIYPRKSEADNAASSLDASEWSTGGANASKLSVSQTDGQTASNVQSITIKTDGTMASGDVAYASYTNQSITTDPTKRVAQTIVTVNTLDSGAEGALEIRDGEGDYVEVTINASQDPANADVIANQTGEGYVFQERLADLTVMGTGDGTLDAIEELRFNVSDADVSATFTMLDTERKSTFTVGEKLENTDDDAALETTTIEEITTPGEHKYVDVASMGSVFDGAVIHNLGVFGLKYDMEHLASEDIQATFSQDIAKPYSGYKWGGDIKGRLLVPTAIDLTHHTLTLRTEQAMVEPRYVAFEYIEGASEDTAFGDYDSWTSLSGNLQDAGDTLTLDDTVQPGQVYAVHSEVLFVDLEEKNNLAQTAGGGTHRQKQPTSWVDMIVGPLGGAIAALLSLIGITWKFGG